MRNLKRNLKPAVRNSFGGPMPADRAAAILARFHAAQRALISQFRELPPGAAEHELGNAA